MNDKMPLLIECPHPDSSQKMIICRECMEKELSKERERSKRLVEALELIRKGEGPFSQDHLLHAENCITAMKNIAEEALREYGGQP